MRELLLISPQKGCGLQFWLILISLISDFGATLQDEEDAQCRDLGDYCRTLRADECYHNEEFCCKSCKKYASENEACKYGDRASVCTDEYCLFSWNLELCCHTCRMNLTSTTTVIITTSTRGTTSTSPLVEVIKRGEEDGTSTSATTDTTTPCDDGLINGISCGKYIQTNGLRFCYRYEQVCCRTCSKIRENNPTANDDCRYGDKRKWCGNITSDQCNANNVTCCATCETLKANISGCQYGDSMPSYCSTLLRQDCYDESEICCGTCHQFIQPGASPDCKYGDWIETKRCVEHKLKGNCRRGNIAEKCCWTCKEDSEEDD